MSQSDTQLVSESLNGNLSAFEILVKRYQVQIFRHTYRLLQDKDAADDATQETFIKTFENLKNFDTRKQFKSWLYKIATNFCIDELRKNSKLVPIQETLVDNTQENAIEKLIKSERVQAVRAALSNLPGIYRQLIIGYYFWQLDYKTLARVFNLPINTVRTRLHRGKIILRRDLYGKV